MNDHEAIEMMNRCKNEIRMLHRQVEALQPKAAAYDNIVIILGLLPRPSIGHGEDLAWLLERRIDELKKKDPIE